MSPPECPRIGGERYRQRVADLTEDLEHQVQARTREAESARNYFRSILLSSPVGIAFLDGERGIQQVNPAFEEIVGRSAEALRGQGTWCLHQDPSEFERVGHEAYPTLKDGGVYRTVTTLQRPDGTSITVSLTGQAVNPEALEEGFIWVVQDITEQRNRERHLQQFRAAFEGSRDAVMLMDESGFYACNSAAVRLYRAADQAALIRLHPADLSPKWQPDGRLSTEAAAERVRTAFQEGTAFFEWTHCTLDGEPFPSEVQLSRVDLDSRPILEAVVRDITQQKQAFEQIRQARDRAEAYFEQARVMMLVLDGEGRVRAINQRGCELLGLPREAIVGTEWLSRFVPASEAGRLAPICKYLEAEGGALPEHLENEIVTATGERRVIAFRNTVLRDGNGDLEGILSSGSDITEQRRLENELQYQANHDPLTGAYNRRRATQLLEAEVERARRYGTPFSVILLDIDHFKPINDRMGHNVGDSVLVELTALAGQRLRELDLLARWGGEEFLIVLPETRQEGAERVAEDLRERVAATHLTGLGALTISLGVAQLAEGQDIDGLTKQADEALYAAKAGGRNRVARAPG